MNFAVVFPGQGSQSLGMLADLAKEYPLIQKTFSEASATLDFDLWELSQNGSAAELNATHNTQPAMLTAGVAVWRLWLEQGGLHPMLLAGHSLGEYTALVCSGSLGFSEAVSLVADRGVYMQEAVETGAGAMAAILGLDDDVLVDVCEHAAEGQVVSCANYNSPGQIVIAGQASAVERAMAAAKNAGAKRAVLLPVSVPSHCQLMEPAAEKLAIRLKSIDIKTPEIPIFHNVDFNTEQDPQGIRDKLVAQLHKPVCWTQTVQAMQTQGIDTLMEFGPGKVLSGLSRRIDRSLINLPVFDPTSLKTALATGDQQ